MSRLNSAETVARIHDIRTRLSCADALALITSELHDDTLDQFAALEGIRVLVEDIAQEAGAPAGLASDPGPQGAEGAQGCGRNEDSEDLPLPPHADERGD